jgi:redox-sensitive bicupin YhaK (pirin superfamily)
VSDVEQILEARPRDLGGFTVGRVLPQASRRFVGPFVFLDHMGPESVDELAVRPHPHLHLATVTYLFAGEIVHRDSLGSAQTISPGAINWMSAGHGISHSERIARDGTAHRVHGLQLWVGLPKAAEDTAPFFNHHPASTLPVIDRDGAHIRVLGGTAFGETSPVEIASPLFYADVALDAGATIELPAGVTDRAAYLIEGAVTIGDTAIEPKRLALFARASQPVIRATIPSRLVVLGGEPLDGPRYMWWNFVSSSKERIVEAAAAWRAGTFPKVVGDTEVMPAPEISPNFAGG